MKRKAKMFITDIDGTMRLKNGKLSAYSIGVLRRLRQGGIVVAVNSGRPFESVCRAIPLACLDYASCGNGQDVYDVKNDFHRRLPTLQGEEIEEILAPMKRHLVVMSVHAEGEFHHFVHPSLAWYGTMCMLARGALALALRRRRSLWRVKTSYGFVKDAQPAKICFSGSPLSLKRYLSDIDESKFQCSFVNPMWLEIQSKGVSKGNAVKWIQQREGIRKDETICAGDGENDIPMMKQCGIRIVPANAMGSVKALATERVPCNRREGVSRWLEANLLAENDR